MSVSFEVLAEKQKNLIKGPCIEVCAELKNLKGVLRPDPGSCGKTKLFLVLKGESGKMVLVVLVKRYS